MIEAYCKQFFGYGRWDAPVWFVGLEEAGAGTPEELQVRLAAWDQCGRREHCLAKTQQFTGQIAAYGEVLRAGGERLENTWIHFPLAGVMVQFK
jgi:hypothetical protein